METAGIVAEYNPFHLGHKYHIDETKRITDLPVTAVMSGNFVQRGECAMFDKSVRAEAALKNGCDLVLELPLPWALSSAERFARGAVSILNATGLCSVISFGSESGDTAAIAKTAESLLALDDNKLKEYLSLGLSYPAARQKAAAQIMPEADSILSAPNDLLAVEYAKTIINTHSAARPLAIKRTGAAHDSTDITDGNSASASFIRNAARQNADYSALIPENTISLYNNAPAADFALLETGILSYLRRKTPEDFTLYPDVSEGLEYRIYDAVRTAKSLDELYSLIKTKRYTHSRIRRIILSAFLECNKNYTLSEPAYIRVLGFTDKGRELLKQMKSTASLPIIMKHSDTYSLPADAKAFYDLECLSTDLYAAAFSPLLPCGLEMKRKIIRL